MLWLIIARDGSDPDAPARRQAVRERHLRELRPLVDAGRVAVAGAILDDAGGMIGSMLVLEAEDERAARALVERDAYTVAGVWRSYELHPFARAV